MKGIENKLLVLKLNKHWKVMDRGTVGDALVDLAAGINCYALNIDYYVDENGNADFSQPTTIEPVNWEKWITLPIRPWDLSIKTVKMEIRVPTILVAKRYDKIPKLKWGNRPSSSQVRQRDGNVCQYTNRILRPDEGSLDHVVPRSRGGGDSWENVVWADKRLNTKKGNKTNEEVGLKLIRRPVKPKPIPRSALIREAKHKDWEIFLEKK